VRYTAILAVLAVLSPLARAELSAEFQAVDNSGAPELAGYVTQDLVIHTTTDWLSAELIVTLDGSGGVYQHPAQSSPQSPSPAAIQGSPALAFDTYVSNGVPGQMVVTMGVAGPSGPPELIFDQDGIRITWFTPSKDDVGDLALARITLDSSASGTWSFSVTASPADGPKVSIDGKVIDGVLYLAGDVNADGFVRQLDLDIILYWWDQSVPPGHEADATGDGFVDQDDLDKVLRDWGYGYFPIRSQTRLPCPVVESRVSLASAGLRTPRAPTNRGAGICRQAGRAGRRHALTTEAPSA